VPHLFPPSAHCLLSTVASPHHSSMTNSPTLPSTLPSGSEFDPTVLERQRSNYSFHPSHNASMANSGTEAASPSTLHDLLQADALRSVREEEELNRALEKDFQYLVMYQQKKWGNRKAGSAASDSQSLSDTASILGKEISFLKQKLRSRVSMDNWENSAPLKLESTEGRTYYILAHPERVTFQDLMSYVHSKHSHILEGSQTDLRYGLFFYRAG
jgi:hypothetical protein